MYPPPLPCGALLPTIASDALPITSGNTYVSGQLYPSPGPHPAATIYNPQIIPLVFMPPPPDLYNVHALRAPSYPQHANALAPVTYANPRSLKLARFERSPAMYKSQTGFLVFLLSPPHSTVSLFWILWFKVTRVCFAVAFISESKQEH